MNGARPVPAPLIVTETTWVIRGKDGTYLGFAFGDGRQSHETNLYNHRPADRVPHLGNCVLSLTGILPDAIGIGVSVGCSFQNPNYKLVADRIRVDLR